MSFSCRIVFKILQNCAPHVINSHIEHNLKSPSRKEYDELRKEIMAKKNITADKLTFMDGFDEEMRPQGDPILVLAHFLCGRTRNRDSDEAYVLESYLDDSLTPDERARRNVKTGNGYLMCMSCLSHVELMY